MNAVFLGIWACSDGYAQMNTAVLSKCILIGGIVMHLNGKTINSY